MFHFARRGRRARAVRFCDGCTEVTTADQRAARHYERTRNRWQALGPTR